MSIVAASVLLAGLDSVAAQEKLPRVVTAEQVLKGFVGELVSIEPGKEKFPGGKVTLGVSSPKDELAAVQVEFTASFRISRYEMTQELYELVMGVNPSRWKGPRNSVEMMTLADAETFCNKLTGVLRRQKLIDESETVRLPTEAEWEYCCCAGTTTRYRFGDSATADGDQSPKATLLDPWAWHTGNAAGNDPPVGALKPNAWGLYDVHGYLWEFVTPDTRLPSVATGSVILRSGSWKDHHSRLTSSSRRVVSAATADDAVGFRCVVSR
ncbi:MAG UNVERIFIED_CONTAM: formylglycine-generating enzyme family protein [Planctomycetaceae bacterium]|jgi:formylglycine-generating enzyme required for sulfatase activity